MALDKTTLIASLKTAFGATIVSDPTSQARIDLMATQVADAVDVFVKLSLPNDNALDAMTCGDFTDFSSSV